MMDFYNKYQPYEERQDYRRRAVLVALGIVYYMRLNSKYREKYKEHMDNQVRMPNEVNFSQVRSVLELQSYNALSMPILYTTLLH